MKKTTATLTILFLISITLFSQISDKSNSYIDHPNKYRNYENIIKHDTFDKDFINSQPAIFKSLNTLKERLDSLVQEIYIDSIDSWIYSEKKEFEFDIDSNKVGIVQYEYTNNQWVEKTKRELAFDDNGNENLVAYYKWDQTSSLWFGHSKYEYEYNSNGALLQKNSYSWNNELNQWAKYSKIDFGYNGNDKLTSYNYYKWDIVQGSWKQYIKEETSYNEESKITVFISYELDANSNELVLVQKDEYSYAENNNLSQEINYIYYIDSDSEYDYKNEYTYDVRDSLIQVMCYSWDKNNEIWDTYNKRDLTYNTNGYLIQVLGYHWSDGENTWDNAYKKIYEWDENGYMTIESNYLWQPNFENWFWKGDSKVEKSFDEDGTLLVEYAYAWNSNTNQWYIAKKDDYLYDEYGNPIEDMYHQYYDIVTDEYTYIAKWEYTYDNTVEISDILLPALSYCAYPDHLDAINNKPLGMSISRFVDGLWNEEERGIYYYSSLNISNNQNISANGIKVYPNPAFNFIQIEIANTNIPATIDIYDLNGKKVFSQSYSINSRLNIEQFKSGLYVLKIIQNTEAYFGKLMIE